MLLLVPCAWAESPDDFRAAIEQARFFVKKGWWVDARAQLERAVASENGRLDPEAWMLLATVAFQLCDVAAARHAADRAHSQSRDLVQAGQAAGLRDWIDQQFGTLTVNAPYDGVVAPLDIVLTSTLFDPELKLYLNRLAARTSSRMALPVTVALPAGSYVVNGVGVEVAAGGSASISPRGRASALQAVQLEVGFGPTFWLAGDVRGLLPAPTTSLGISLPAGPLQLGLTAAWTPQPFRTATDDVRLSSAGYEIGGRIGRELTRGDPLHVRASLGYAYGVIPGVAVPCAAPPETACGAGVSADLWVHLPARAHQPRAELAVLYLDHGPRASFGGGLVTAFSAAFGTLEADGTATGADGSTWAYTLADGDAGFTGWSVRGLATVTVTF